MKSNLIESKLIFHSDTDAAAAGAAAGAAAASAAATVATTIKMMAKMVLIQLNGNPIDFVFLNFLQISFVRTCI